MAFRRDACTRDPIGWIRCQSLQNSSPDEEWASTSHRPYGESEGEHKGRLLSIRQGHVPRAIHARRISPSEECPRYSQMERRNRPSASNKAPFEKVGSISVDPESSDS